MSNGIGHVWAVNAEGGDEGRPNGVGPVWIENADQLGSKLPEPASGDAGKVLGVLNSDGDIGWVPDQEGMAQVQADWDQDDPTQVSYIVGKPTIPTVDQTYSASSSNAQSGVAVAQAIAAIPSASYSPGDGIAISMSHEISVDHDDTLSSAYRYETENVDKVSKIYKAGIAIGDGSPLDFVINDYEVPDATLKIHIPGNTFFTEQNNIVAAKVIIADTVEFDHNAYAPDATLSVTYDSQNHRYVIDEQDVKIKAFCQEWEPISGGLQDRATYLGFGFYTNRGPQYITPSFAAQVSSTTLTDPVVIDVPMAANKLISVANPVPASAVGDAGKVLTVNAQGAPAWATPAAGGATLTPVLKFTSMSYANHWYSGSFTKYSGPSGDVTLTAGKLYVVEITLTATTSASNFLLNSQLWFIGTQSIVYLNGGTMSSIQDANNQKLLFNGTFVPKSKMTVNSSNLLNFDFNSTFLVGTGSIDSISVNRAVIYELS